MTSTPTAPILAIVGVTASGKSALAMELARTRGDTELVSVDSMQIYRGMDIGTAKPTVAERAEVRHHLIDVVDPYQDFSVSEFQQAARVAIADIEARGAVPLLVGGTGLHLRAVVDDLEIPGRFPDVLVDLDAEPDTIVLFDRLRALDPAASERMEPTNRRRVLRALEVTIGSGRLFSSYGPGLETYSSTRFRMVGPRWSRSAIDERIAARYAQQVEAGLLGEVKELIEAPGGLSRTAAQALGYRQLLSHLAGEADLDDALSEAIVATRRFARRQERWFRRDPRITWIDVESKPMEAFDQLVGQWGQRGPAN